MDVKAIAICAFLAACEACAHRPVFPENGAPPIDTPAKLVALVSNAERFRGQDVKVAGRLVRGELDENGITILADWLPYPEDTYSGPIQTADGTGLRFFLLYPGAIDSMGLWQGNEFLARASTAGVRELIGLQATSQPLPVLRAQCLHVWKTGASDLSEFVGMDPLDDRYAPPLQETYCVTASR